MFVGPLLPVMLLAVQPADTPSALTPPIVFSISRRL
jgi:hypothetical protein